MIFLIERFVVLKRKIGVLSLSLVTGIATIITTIIPLIAASYPTRSITSVETLVTISSLSALITILFNQKIVSSFGLKRVIMIGLFIGLIAGVYPFFLTSYYFIMVSRVLLGVGIGLYSPHAISLISLLFDGAERNYLLGIQMGIGAFGNAILLFMAGNLANISWKFTFLVYLFLGVILIVVWKYVPNIQIEKRKKNFLKKPLDRVIIRYLILCFFTFVIIWGVQLKIPSFLVEQGINSTEKISFLLSSMNIAGMLAGLTFGFVFKKVKIYLLPIGFLGAGLSILGMVVSTNWLIIFWTAFAFNFIYSFTGPTISVEINKLATKEQVTRVNSLIMMTTILSSYAAPLIWNNLTFLFTKSNSAQNAIIIMTISLFGIGFILLWFLTRTDNYKIKIRQ